MLGEHTDKKKHLLTADRGENLSGLDGKPNQLHSVQFYKG